MLATFGVIILKTRALLCGGPRCSGAATSVSVCNRLHALVQAAVLEYGFADEREHQRRKARRSPLGRVRVCGGHRERPVDASCACPAACASSNRRHGAGFGGPGPAFACHRRTRWPPRRGAESARSLSAPPAGRTR